MKHLLCSLATALLVAAVRAQTNAPDAAARTPTEIYSDTADFNTKTRVVIYRGHVRVDDSQMHLTCEVMTARTAEEGGHIENIVAEGNVIVDMVNQGQTNHATGRKLVYTYKVEYSVTNDMAVLTGDPRFEQGNSWMAADSISWERTTGNIFFTHPHGVSKNNLMGGAAPPPAATNPAPAGP